MSYLLYRLVSRISFGNYQHSVLHENIGLFFHQEVDRGSKITKSVFNQDCAHGPVQGLKTLFLCPDG